MAIVVHAEGPEPTEQYTLDPERDFINGKLIAHPRRKTNRARRKSKLVYRMGRDHYTPLRMMAIIPRLRKTKKT